MREIDAIYELMKDGFSFADNGDEEDITSFRIKISTWVEWEKVGEKFPILKAQIEAINSDSIVVDWERSAFRDSYAWTVFHDRLSGMTLAFDAKGRPVEQFFGGGDVFSLSSGENPKDLVEKYKGVLFFPSLRDPQCPRFSLVCDGRNFNYNFTSQMSSVDFTPMPKTDEILACAPIMDILSFLAYSSSLKNGLERYGVKKWPESIQEKLEKWGLTYDEKNNREHWFLMTNPSEGKVLADIPLSIMKRYGPVEWHDDRFKSHSFSNGLVSFSVEFMPMKRTKQPIE